MFPVVTLVSLILNGSVFLCPLSKQAAVTGSLLEGYIYAHSRSHGGFSNGGPCLEKGQAGHMVLAGAGHTLRIVIQEQCPVSSPPQPAAPPSQAANYGLRVCAQPAFNFSGAHLSFTFRILIISSLSSWLPPRPVWK